MSDPRPIVRRKFLGLLAGVAAVFTVPGRLAFGAPPDQGIAGTGVLPLPDEAPADRGIGGTGVIGTIRRFGSIVVNDLRISYPADALVRIDGETATPAALKLGQVVRVVANRRDDAYSTQTIDVTSEVVGRVEKSSAKTLTVLGQTVSTDGPAGARRWRRGDHVAVSGLRRPDGTIVASLIERRSGTAARVAGPVVATADGTLKIGNLTLSGVDRSLVGQRAVLEGSRVGRRFEVANGTAEPASFGPAVRQVSIEGYVERSDGGLRLGSGLKLGGNGNLQSVGPVRAVIMTSVDRAGRLNVESVHLDSRSGGGGAPGPHSGPRGPGPGGGGRRFDRPGHRFFEPGGRLHGPGGGHGPGGFGRPLEPGGPPGGLGGPSGPLAPGGLGEPGGFGGGGRFGGPGGGGRR